MDADAQKSEVVWIEDFEGFLAVEAEWDALAAHEASPFVTHAALRCWFEAFGTGDPRICTVRRDGRLVAALPLQERRGSLISWSNSASDAVAPLAETPADLEALLDALLHTRWSQLVLRAIPAEHPATRMIEQRLERIAVVRREPFQESPVVDTAGSFDDYARSMSQNTRRRVARHRRKLERDHDVRFVLLDVPDDPIARVDAALEVEAGGWKGRGFSAVVDSPEKLRFHHGLAARLGPRGEYAISELYVDDKLVAFDLSLLRAGRLALLITSYDEGFAAYSPGLMLRMAIVEACFERGLVANDLLSNNSQWKSHFANAARPTVVLRAYRRRPLPLVRAGFRGSVWPHVRGTYNHVHDLRRRAKSPRGGAAEA